MKKTIEKKILSGLLPGLLALGILMPVNAWADAVPVEIRERDGLSYLYRNGEVFFIKGAGGNHDMELLARSGANSLRTWGRPEADLLDRAQELGLTVCLGLWIEHERHGFDYDDPDAVAAQIRRHKETIDLFKDHPAVLLWGIGNEVELEYTNPRVWEVVEAVAAYAREVDPDHPTMTVTAHVDAEVVSEIRKKAPSIDILGVNSYGGVGVVARAVREADWEKPYIITEWGVDGSWEVERTSWGAEIEPTSTEKAMQFAVRYAAVSGSPRCLGSYAFHWGAKQETTPTWFNIFDEKGAATESLEVLQYLWTGDYPEARAPRIAGMRINGERALPGLVLEPGAPAVADFIITQGWDEELKVHWELMPESTDKRIGGDREDRPETVMFDTFGKSRTHLEFEVPQQPGPYRLYLYVYGDGNTVATANFPFYVSAP
jgi:hypothetical protein